MRSDTTATAPAWLILAALTGWIAGLFGIYWDEAWHTDVGRDTFWSPPHLFIYGGVAIVGLALAAWTWMSLRRGRISRPIVIGLSGAALTIASGPIDDWWHLAFGRDAVVWSPPHMAALAGVVLLVGSLLIEGARFPGRSGRLFASLASSGLLAALLIAVYEYEGDVPQFPIVLYLPLLAGVSSLAFALIRRIRGGESMPATQAAGVYTALMVVVVTALAVLGHSLPTFTIILGPAITFDLMGRVRSQIARAAVFTASLFALYIPYLNLVQKGVFITGLDAVLGFPVAVLLSWAALVAVEGWPRRIPARRLALAMGLLVLLVPGTALAHDPGFGDDIAAVALQAEVVGTSATVSGILSGIDCARFEAVRVVARRAGTVHEGALSLSGCRLSGSVELPDRGRWFVYTELSLDETPHEAWIAVKVGSTASGFTRDTTIYLAPVRKAPPLKYIAGVALYAVSLGSLTFMVRTARGSNLIHPDTAMTEATSQ